MTPAVAPGSVPIVESNPKGMSQMVKEGQLQVKYREVAGEIAVAALKEGYAVYVEGWADGTWLVRIMGE